MFVFNTGTHYHSQCKYVPEEWLNICVCNMYTWMHVRARKHAHTHTHTHTHICVMNIIILVTGEHFVFDAKP